VNGAPFIDMRTDKRESLTLATLNSRIFIKAWADEERRNQIYTTVFRTPRVVICYGRFINFQSTFLGVRKLFKTETRLSASR